MKTVKRAISILTGSALLATSCNMASHRYFTAYKNEPFDSVTTRIKINGMYFISDYSKRHHNYPTLFFLYADGSVYSSFGGNMSKISEGKFWSYPEEYMRTLRLNAIGSPGHFLVRKENITIQVFDINPGGVFPITTIEFTGRIATDSTFILSPFSTLYRFYKTDIRPDSSAIWFKRKKWYRSKVWNRNIRVVENSD